MDGHYSNVPCLAEYDSRGAPVLIENLKQTIARPPLIEINTDISGKTNLLFYLVRWSATPRRFESRETRGPRFSFRAKRELRLNRLLAPDVYRDVVPLVHSTNGLTIGDIVDWLVLMDRLDERLMLDSVIAEKRLHRWQLDRLAAAFIEFYRHANAVLVPPAVLTASASRKDPAIPANGLVSRQSALWFPR